MKIVQREALVYLNMIHLEKYRQPFLDDGAVENIKGATRTLHSPKKWGPIITGGI